MKYLQLALVLIVAVVLGACSKDENAVSLTDLVGTYQLQSAKVTFEDNSVVELSSEKNEITGSFIIETNGDLVQTISVTGVDQKFIVTGSIENVVDDKLYVKSGGCSYHVPFEYRTASGKNILTLNLERGTCGAQYSEQDVWVKIEQNNKKPLDEITNEEVLPGGVIGNIMRPF